MGELRPWHIVVIVIVVFVLFGYKKLPDATRSLGRSLRILKTEVKTLHEDEAPEAAPETGATTPPPVAPRAVEAPRTVAAPREVEATRAVVRR
jgi:sec-independent protein translocase protein TatA